MLDIFTSIYFEIACSKIAATNFLFAIESLAYLLDSDPDTAMPLPPELATIFPQDSKVDHFPAAWSEWTGLLAAFEDSEDTDLGIEVRYDDARGRLCIVDTFSNPTLMLLPFWFNVFCQNAYRSASNGHMTVRSHASMLLGVGSWSSRRIKSSPIRHMMQACAC